MQTYKVTGNCFLAGVVQSAQRIERTIEAPSFEAAAEKAFKGFHTAIWARVETLSATAWKPCTARYVGMYSGRACGSVTVEQVSK